MMVKEKNFICGIIDAERKKSLVQIGSAEEFGFGFNKQLQKIRYFMNELGKANHCLTSQFGPAYLKNPHETIRN